MRTDNDRVRSRTDQNGSFTGNICESTSSMASPDRTASPDESAVVTTRSLSPDVSANEQSKLHIFVKKVESFFQLFINPIFLKAFILTFIAEWGDRSQLSTVVLAVSTVSSYFKSQLYRRIIVS